MKKTKRLVSLCVAIVMVMVMTVCPTFAATTPKAAVEYTPTVTVEKVANEKKAGDTFDLKVSIAGNQGFTNFQWNIKYDNSRLKLTEITQKDSSLGSFVKNTDKNGMGYVTCASATATKVNGELFTLSFAVKSGAATGDATVEIKNDKFENNGSTINATYVPGGVKVEGTTGGSTTGGSTTGGSTTGGSTTGGTTTGGSTTGGSTTGGSTTGGSTTGGSTTGGSTTGGSTTGGSTTGGSTTGGSTTGGSTTGGSTTGGSTTGGSTTGGSTTGGSTTGGSTTGGSTTGGSTTGGEETEIPELDVNKDGVATPNDKYVEEAINAAGNGNIKIDIANEQNAKTLNITNEQLVSIAQEDKALEIKSPEGNVVFDAKALDAIVAQANGQDISLKLIVNDKASADLNDKQTAAVKDVKIPLVIDLALYAGNNYIGDFRGGNVTVTIPFVLEQGKTADDYSVIYIADNGKLTKVPASFANGVVTFTTGHFSSYAVAEAGTLPADTPQESPKTGDTTNMLPWVALVAIGVVGAGAVVIKRREN